MTAATPAVPARRPSVLADLLAGTAVRTVVLVLAGAVFVGLAAQVSIPVPGSPVPITGQTFAVLLSGAALGWRRGLASMALYLVAGVGGMPWFSGQASGWNIPSLGYVFGFVLAGAVVGAVAGRGGDRTPLRTAGTMVIGDALIYLIGVPYLMISLHLSLHAGFVEGVRPFLVGDALKLVAAAGLLPGAWALVNRSLAKS